MIGTWYCRCEDCVYDKVPEHSNKCEVCVQFSNYHRKLDPSMKPISKNLTRPDCQAELVMKPRLIDANVLRSEVEAGMLDDERHEDAKLLAIHRWEYAHFIRMIDTAPTVDALPVRRGHWETTEASVDSGMTTCSYCHNEFYIAALMEVGNEDGYCEFCPSCGADMREEEKA